MPGSVTVLNLTPKTVFIAANVDSHRTYTVGGVEKIAGGYSADRPGTIELAPNGSTTLTQEDIINDALLNDSLQAQVAEGNIAVMFAGAALSASDIDTLAEYDYEIHSAPITTQLAGADVTVILGLVQRPGDIVSASFISDGALAIDADNNPQLWIVNGGSDGTGIVRPATLDLTEVALDALVPEAMTVATGANAEVAAGDVLIAQKVVEALTTGAIITGRFSVTIRVKR